MKLPEMALAQVETPYPEDFSVGVVFPHLGFLSAVRVRVSAPGATATAGEFGMPQRGDFGLVTFFQDDVRSGRWLLNLTDSSRHAIPKELLGLDPDARVSYERSGRENYRHGNGDLEVQHPDGSIFTLTHQETRGMGSRTERKISVPKVAGQVWDEVRKSYRKHKKKVLELYFKQQGHLEASLDKDGTLHLKLLIPDEPPPKLRYDVRLDTSGTLTAKNRAESQIIMEEQGDVTIETKTEAKVVLGKLGDITVSNASGATVHIDLTGNIDVNPGGAGVLRLAGGGQPIARLGDTVTTPAGPGTITGGSSKVFSG